jgi:hypothetical protein
MEIVEAYPAFLLASGFPAEKWTLSAGLLACFEVMGNVCAIRAHTQEPCSNDQTLQILSAAFASEGNCRKSRRAPFFFIDVFTDF